MLNVAHPRRLGSLAARLLDGPAALSRAVRDYSECNWSCAPQGRDHRRFLSEKWRNLIIFSGKMTYSIGNYANDPKRKESEEENEKVL